MSLSCNPFFDAGQIFSILHMIGHVMKQYEFFSFLITLLNFSGWLHQFLRLSNTKQISHSGSYPCNCK